MEVERMTMEAYAQARANATRSVYCLWQIPGTDICSVACRDRLNTRAYRECGYSLVREYRPQPVMPPPKVHGDPNIAELPEVSGTSTLPLPAPQRNGYGK